MTEAQNAALEKWASIAGERAATEEFMDWAAAHGAQITYGFTNRRDLLDRFYGINRGDLESARRALLAESQPRREAVEKGEQA